MSARPVSSRLRRQAGASAENDVPANCARNSLVAYSRKLGSAGLSRGKSGNISVRSPGGMLISATGASLAELTTQQVVEMSLDGVVEDGDFQPSSEWMLHSCIYDVRADVQAIVHTHALNVTALACLRKPIPAFHYMVAEFGGDKVDCAPYTVFGSAELARGAVKALGNRYACLLSNHGAVCVGEDLHCAFERMLSLEMLAAQYLLALQVGDPRILSKAEMRKVLTKFQNYGQNFVSRASR